MTTERTTFPVSYHLELAERLDDEENYEACCSIKELVSWVRQLKSERRLLIQSAAVLSVAILKDDVDSAEEHWQTIPAHLQQAIDLAEKQLDSQVS